MSEHIQIIPDNEIAIDATLHWAGYAALQRFLGGDAPLQEPCAIADRHIRGSIRQEKGIRLYDQRYKPQNDVAGHLFFALKHETLNLLALQQLLIKLGAASVSTIVASHKEKQQARRLWFLYEWLTGEKLPLEDAPSAMRYLPLLDPDRYFTGAPRASARHKIIDNLLGGRAFCPIVRKTEALQTFIGSSLADRIEQVMGRTSREIWLRAASFLLLADSRASFAIEGEHPARNRIERWGEVIQQAGYQPLSLSVITAMHDKLIRDHRFVQRGLRTAGVFLGERSREGEPLPEFIGARPEDISALIEGLLESHRLMTSSSIDAVIHTAVIAFGFVLIHPFEDGNGRMHRALIHHTLAERGFAQAGMIFPVSAVMLERIEEYQRTLRNFSAPLMGSIEWEATAESNVEVLNETADLYRFGDYTAIAEFLYRCVEHTILELLPKEVHHLECYDRAVTVISARLDMPGNQIRNLIMFITQNGMKLPQRRRQKEFAALSDNEVIVIEADVARAFNSLSHPLTPASRAPSKSRQRLRH